MRVKIEFVTNSSSTCYLVQNISKTDNLTARAFIDSIWPHIQDEMKYHEYNYTKEEILKSLIEEDKSFRDPIPPGGQEYMIWGDEQDTIVGRVFDYVLREGIETGLVRVSFDQHLR